MTVEVDIVNRALQIIGTRTTVASLTEQSNEAIQANIILEPLRDALLRMAPWNCGTIYNNLVLITATPGTPENPSVGPQTTWQRGIPPPPWAYEYQYPVDCLRPIYIIPQFSTGFASGIPITTAVTGAAPAFWLGPPQKYKVAVDQFFMVQAATVANSGTNYQVGEVITLVAPPPATPPSLGIPIPGGAPAQLVVLTTGVGQSVATVGVVPQIIGTAALALGGSYLHNQQVQPIGQASSTNFGTGATFNLTYSSVIPNQEQRVILTNQEFATLCYVRQVQNPNVMDENFLEAWAGIVGARLAIQLTGDKAMANMGVALANNLITEARKADANEGLTINDVTPDFIRTRGIYYPTWEISPNIQFDWGPMFASY
jgi:hypothetical protein